MAHANLVSLDLLHGQRVVQLLEDAGFKAEVALWLLTEEFSDWRLVLAAKSLNALSPLEQIRTVKSALRKTMPESDIPTLWIMKTTEALPRELKKLFGRASSVEGMRLGGQSIGDRFIEDAYVYRIR